MAKAVAKRASELLVRFEAVKIEPLFGVVDAVAWLDGPTAKHIAQFANIDPRTAGKILKNARLIGLLASPDDATYVLAQPIRTKEQLTRSGRLFGKPSFVFL
jgi:hypothetical protein